ncbi:MAG: hypothetical protein IT348_03145 [Candidatus Eisenbacteria bacterium]|nr:hypothetical protein [Candidatus Eisenbacteria bacterium]
MSVRVRAAVLGAALAIVTGASCGPRDRQTVETLVGEWRGHVAWRDGTTPVVLHVAADGESLVATLDAAALGVSAQPVGRVSFDSPRVHFEVKDSAASHSFDGWLRRGLVVGSFSPLAGAGASGAVTGQRNPSLLPQLSLKRWERPTQPSPWPEGVVGGEPPVVPAPERSLGEWLSRR